MKESDLEKANAKVEALNEIQRGYTYTLPEEREKHEKQLKDLLKNLSVDEGAKVLLKLQLNPKDLTQILRVMPANYRTDTDCVLAILKQDKSWRLMDVVYKDEEGEVFLFGAKQDKRSKRFASIPEVKEVILEIAQADVDQLAYIPENFLDKKMMLALVEKNADAAYYFPKNLEADKDLQTLLTEKTAGVSNYKQAEDKLNALAQANKENQDPDIHHRSLRQKRLESQLRILLEKIPKEEVGKLLSEFEKTFLDKTQLEGVMPKEYGKAYLSDILLKEKNFSGIVSAYRRGSLSSSLFNDFFSDKAVKRGIIDIIDSYELEDLPSQLRGDKDFMLAIISRYPEAKEYLALNLKKDQDFQNILKKDTIAKYSKEISDTLAKYSKGDDVTEESLQKDSLREGQLRKELVGLQSESKGFEKELEKLGQKLLEMSIYRRICEFEAKIIAKYNPTSDELKKDRLALDALKKDAKSFGSIPKELQGLINAVTEEFEKKAKALKKLPPQTFKKQSDTGTVNKDVSLKLDANK